MVNPYDLDPTGHLAAQFPELEQMACMRCQGTGRVVMEVEGQRLQMPCAVCAEGWHRVESHHRPDPAPQRCRCGDPITLEVERDAGECLECLHRRYILAFKGRCSGASLRAQDAVDEIRNAARMRAGDAR